MVVDLEPLQLTPDWTVWTPVRREPVGRGPVGPEIRSRGGEEAPRNPMTGQSRDWAISWLGTYDLRTESKTHNHVTRR